MAGSRSGTASRLPQPDRFWRPYPNPQSAGRSAGSSGSAHSAHEPERRGGRLLKRWHESSAHMTETRPDQIRTILFYAQDNRGLGHINRTLTIARHVLAAYPNF